MMGGKGIAIQHEYIIWGSLHEGKFEGKNENVKLIINKAESIIKELGGINNKSKEAFAKWIKKADGLTGGERAYQYIDDDGRVYRHVAMTWPNPNPPPEQFFIPLIHPVTKKPCAVPTRGWSRTPKKMQELIDRNEIVFGKDETTQPQRKIFLSIDSRKPIPSIISNGKKGKNEIERIGIDFTYSHPVSLYEELIFAGLQKNSGCMLDYFAGSGTSANAVINLNREDGGTRKYVLVEQGLYFYSATKPRIQKVIYSDQWKAGKPVSRKGSSHIFKYSKLESYEDSVNNLKLARNDFQEDAILNLKEEYLLTYMLDMEKRDSLLTQESFESPFDYQMQISTKTVGEAVSCIVDLVETFNYLIGLKVSHINRIQGMVVIEGRRLSGEKTLVIWRDLRKVDNEKLDQFFETLDIRTRDFEYDLIYVNGDNNLPNLRAADENWKVRLIEEDFLKLMFEVEEL